jgi:hypothetical protein
MRPARGSRRQPPQRATRSCCRAAMPRTACSRWNVERAHASRRQCLHEAHAPLQATLLRVFGLMLTRRESMVHAHLASGSSFWLLRSRTPTLDDCTWQKSSIFGIAWTALTVNEAKGGNVASLTASHPQFFGARLAETLQPCKARTFLAWLAAAASVFVYRFQAADRWSKRMWAGGARDLRTAVASREVTPVSECLSTQMKRAHR